MAVFVTRQVTLTDKNDSGPFFNVLYSNDNITYYPSPDGQGVYLPSVGASVTVQVATNTNFVKLVSTGQCTNQETSGSVPSTTSTTTVTPFSVYKAQRDNPLSFISVTYVDPYGKNRSSSWSTDTPKYFIARFINNTQNAIITNLGTLTEPNQVYETGSLLGNDGFTTEVTNTDDAYVDIYWLDGTDKTPRFWPITSFSSREACMLSGSLMFGANSITGLSVSESVGAQCTGPTTTSTTSTTTTTTTCVPQGSLNEVISGYASLGDGAAAACSSTDIRSTFNSGFWTNSGTKIYSDETGCTYAPNGWYAPISGESGAGFAYKIENGEYSQQTVCGSTPTTTTTTSTTAAPTTTSTTSTTTVTPVTQIWSDTIPRYGNLRSCGCTGQTGTFNFQILGNNVDIYSDITGRLIYEDWDTGTVFIGDDLWYCITDAENTETTISIRINNFGYVEEWVDCTTTTTTTTTSTTTTTTSATGCYEYLVECRTQGGCFVSYTDCNGDSQGFTQQYDTAGVICARPTPTITGGVVEFLGNCNLTTTTTTTVAPTTTTTTQPVYSGLRRCTDGTTNWYYEGQLSSGQFFLSGGGYCYVSEGTITDISGKTRLDGTPNACTCYG